MAKSSMQKEVEASEAEEAQEKGVVEIGEQRDLIDVQPENAKEIISAARLYKRFQTARIAAGNKEAEQKQRVLRLVKAAHLQTLDGGRIKYEHDGVIISVTPRDELVKVEDKSEED